MMWNVRESYIRQATSLRSRSRALVARGIDHDVARHVARNCGSNTYDGHRGTDIAIYGTFAAQDAGRNVVAAAPGSVVAAHDGEFDRYTSGSCGGGGGFGNYVAIRHADGKVTHYSHMRRGSVRVRVGQSVACGDWIGQVGSSGNSTGPHCHFEVRLGGTSPDDPFAARSGCGGPSSYWVSQGAYRSLPAETCESPPPPPPPPPPPCDTREGDVARSCDGPEPRMTCVNVQEPSDPHTWSDNHFCSATDLGIAWSFSGPREGMRCVAITEPSEPAAQGWGDNYLCAPESAPWEFAWSFAGPIAGIRCLRWSEPADPDAWTDNFLCFRPRTPTVDAGEVDAPTPADVLTDAPLPEGASAFGDAATDAPVLDATLADDARPVDDATPPDRGALQGGCACATTPPRTRTTPARFAWGVAALLVVTAPTRSAASRRRSTTSSPGGTARR